jgi:phage/plasmid primase-like uncharacterized protein
VTPRPLRSAPDHWIDRARAVSIEQVLVERGIVLKGHHGRLAGPCPLCGGVDRFAINLNKGEGVFHCRGCGAKGGGAISLVMFLDSCGFLSAVESLAGPPPGAVDHEEDRDAREQRARERCEQIERQRREREADEAAKLRETIAYCDHLWAQTVPLPSEAVAYFQRRGIALDGVPDMGGLCWHPAFPLWIGGPKRPSIVARFTDAITGAPGGIWHRPTTGEKPRTLGRMKGHVIRLWRDDAVSIGLCIAEGVETALAAATRIEHRGTILRPMWACGCRTNIASFPILPGVEHLTIVSDNDASGHGQRDARACARRWAGAGREAEVLLPNITGEDFNDIVRCSS